MDLYGPARVSKYLAWSTLASLILTSFAPTPWFLTLSVAVLGASIGALDVAMNGWGAEVEREVLSRLFPHFTRTGVYPLALVVWSD